MTAKASSVIKIARLQIWQTLVRITPRLSHTVLIGNDAESAVEGNIVELARAFLDGRYGKALWIGAPPHSYLVSQGLSGSPFVLALPSHRHIRSILAYLTARCIFFTHGAYGQPQTPARVAVVNVWHGEPYKAGPFFPNRSFPGPSSTFVVGSTRELAAIKAEMASVPSSAAIIGQNPRVDQFRRPINPAQFKLLGIDPTRPVVIWMPTFRQSKGTRHGSQWTNTTDPNGDVSVSDQLASHLSVFSEHKIQLVIKPLPLDATTRDINGAISISDHLLLQTGVGVYQLLGHAAALITDYSSTWIDYAVLNRPIAFFSPDRSAFQMARGVIPYWSDKQLPGSVLRTNLDFNEFAHQVARTISSDEPLGAESVKAFGESTFNAAHHVVTEVWLRMGWNRRRPHSR